MRKISRMFIASVNDRTNSNSVKCAVKTRKIFGYSVNSSIVECVAATFMTFAFFGMVYALMVIGYASGIQM